jgi:hypothetical protein
MKRRSTWSVTRDSAFGRTYTWRIRAMGIRDQPIAAHSPWQNGHVEWLIGSIRRECLDHFIVFGEAHLGKIGSEKRGFISICKLRTAGAQPSTTASTIDGAMNANFVRRAT